MLLSLELPSLPGLPSLPARLPFGPPTSQGRLPLKQRWPRIPQPQAVATASATLPAAAVDAQSIPKSTVIVGGGPTGLAAAIMLARLGWSGIQVLERLPEPPSPEAEAWGDPARSYNIGLGARGQGALQQLGVWDDVVRWCAPVVGRRDWRPDGTSSERIYTNRGYITQVLQRDRLASCLLAHLRSRYGDKATVTYEAECEAVLSWPWEASSINGKSGGARCGGGGQVAFRLGEGGQVKRLEADLIIGCDGIKSAVRSAMENDPSGMRKASGKPLRVVRYKEENARVFRAVLLRLKGEGWRSDLNYSAQLKGDVTLEALPTKEGMFVGVVLHRPGDAALAAVKTAEDARSFFSTKFPQFYDSISAEEFQNFATRKTFSLPGFCYCGPVLNRGAGALLLGDAIHVVKPYFGLGANSALEDVMVLEECLASQGLGAPGPVPDEAAAAAAGSALAAAIVEDAEGEVPAGGNVPLETALRMFTKKRAVEAKTLVKMSRTFDNTGIWGAITFVIPIILDSLSYNLLPQVFAPNSIAYLQKAGVPFTEVRARKARDRILQVTVLSVLAAAAFKATAAAVRALLPLLRPCFGL